MNNETKQETVDFEAKCKTLEEENEKIKQAFTEVSRRKKKINKIFIYNKFVF